MNRTTALITAGLLLAAMAIATAALYPSLPERFPIHWGVSGEVDGWMPKPWGPWLAPLITVALVALMLLLPWLSPNRFRIDSFRPTYHLIYVEVAALFTGVHVVSLIAAIHPEWDSGRWLIGLLCVGLGVIGNLLGKVRRNFWVGVRTPWTLASDAVWDATHRLAARLTLAGGIIGALFVTCGGTPIVALIVVIAGLIIPSFWSLVYYKRFEAAGKA